MKITTWLQYEVPYVPPRCRKTRYEERYEYVEINLREVSADKLTLAYEDLSYDGNGKIYRYAGKLWAKAKMPNLPKDELARSGVKTPLDWLVYHNRNFSTYFFKRTWDGDSSRATVLKRAKADMAKMLLVDGVLYEQTTKPEYHIMVFGWGGCGGGTALFVSYPARRDCGWRFTAEHGAEAVAKANEVAERRGDMDCVGKFKEMIVTY